MKTLNKENPLFIALSIALTVSIFGFAGAVLAQPINVTVTTIVISGVNQATFIATENGAAKANVRIYVDGVLSGQTDLNGKHVASGLTTGSHAWKAEYGGGSVGIGKFVFFGYGILATGTDSPPIDFSYAINVTASRSGVWGYDAETSGEYIQCFIDTPGLASSCYYKCKRREIRANFSYGITFDSNPSISISSTGYDGANPHVGDSPWYNIVEERPDGCILRSFVFYVGYTQLGRKVDQWIPGDNAQFSCTWSGSKAGSNRVTKNDADKHIDTISSAPISGTSLSLTVNGVTYHGEYSVEGGGVKLWFVGNELHAAYIASPQPWSQPNSGTGSVTDKDADKLITVCPLEAPNNDTKYALAHITVDGVVVHDQDGNDLDRNTNAIEYKGVIAWMQGKELHASMSYHPPAAFIDSISPKLAQIGEAIAFNGHGEEQDDGDFITTYKWRSHKDGELSALNTFTTTLLSPGRHVIYFQVADSTPYTQPYTPLWSPEATDIIRVNKPPTAYISSIRGTGVDVDGYPTLVLGEPMAFNGIGIDTDGYITGYEWRSNISGLLSTSELPVGHHTIYLKVEDNDGAWSKEVAKEIIVRRTPVVFISGYDWRSSAFGKISYRPEILDPEGTMGESNLLLEPRTGDLIAWAHKLSDEIYKLKIDTGTRKVDIVAYSAGGLTARWYIEKGYRNDVRKFVSIGSPHHGLDWGYATGLIELFEPEKGGGRHITPHSHFLKELNGHDGCATTRGRGTDQIKHDVQYYVITGNCLFTCSHQHTEKLGIDLIMGTRCSRNGDSCVPAESARLDGAVYIEDFCGKHEGYHERSDVRAKIEEILHDDSLAYQNIVQGSGSTLAPLFQDKGNFIDSAEDVLTAFHRSEPILDTICPGGIKSHTAQVDPTVQNAIFELQGLCELDLILFSPSGVVIDPSDPDISYTEYSGYILYEIPDPEPGKWTLEVTEPGVADSECNYAIRTFLETDLFVGVGTDKNEYKPNDPIMIYGYVQDEGAPFEGASVTAQIQKQDASPETVSLFDDGVHDDGEANDGVYANTYYDSSESGVYNIAVTATIPAGGETYSRSAWTTVWVQLLPDLAVSDSDIAFSNTNPVHGDTVTITATVHNIVDADANEVKILFFDGDPAESGISIGEGTIDLPAGDSRNVSMPWKAVRGTHTIHVIISPFNDFLEQTYNNNRASANITVEDTELPTADAGPDRVALVDTPVFFDGSGSTDNAGIVSYTWDVDTSDDSDGDGTPDNDVDLTGVNPIYAGGYHSTGTYIVKLSVDDADGNGPVSDTLIVDVTSEYDREPPVGVAGSHQSVRLRVPVFFDASQSNDNFGIASYQWDIDISADSDQDGIPDNDIDLIGLRPTLASGYSKSGDHIVKLRVDDVAGNGPVVDTLIVTVINSTPVPDAAGPYVAEEGSLVLLDGRGSEDPDGDQLQYRWDFDNDGTWDTDWSAVSTAHYTWRDDHSGLVSLEISDGDLSDIVTAEATISNVAPKVEAGRDKTVEVGTIVSFSGFIADPGELDTHTIDWDFGDGNTATGDLIATHKYDEIGEYLVELAVTDDDGATEKDTLLVSVLQKTSPEVTTGAATDVTSNSAVLKGTLVDLGTGLPVQVIFKWGLDTSYGHETASQPMTCAGAFSVDITSLRGSTTYHFRAKAIGDGISYGEDMTFTTASPPPPTTVWVDDDYNPGVTGGHTWGYDAFDSIQDGINAVASPGKVEVAAGNYTENITMKSGVEIIGSGKDVTTIDGDGIGSVVSVSDVDSTARLDEFTIINGNADVGGGIHLINSCPTISSCIFSGNSASYGGAIRCTSSSPTIANCTISGNQASYGGGIGCWSDSSPTITNCTISDNKATEGWGGGIFLSASSPNITDCIIRDNTAVQSGGIECTDGSSPTISACTIKGNQAQLGGGIRCYRGAAPAINNCIISDNSAIGIGGGIVCQDYAEPLFVNCTIADNEAGSYGGGIVCHGYPSWPTLTNCILWGNAPDEVGCGTDNITYCNIDQDGYAGSNGNIRQDPLFVDPENDDFRLDFLSPCIDLGGPIEWLFSDYRGSLRPISEDIAGWAQFDMGAFEHSYLWGGTSDAVTKAFEDVTIDEFNAVVNSAYSIQWRDREPFPDNDERVSQAGEYEVRLALVDDKGRRVDLKTVTVTVSSEGYSTPITFSSEHVGNWNIRIELVDDPNQFELSSEQMIIRDLNPDAKGFLPAILLLLLGDG